MKEKLSEEQVAVINEFIEISKNTTGIHRAGMYSNQILYDFNYGKGQSIELLNEYFYDIIKENNLLDYQIKKLAKEISRREHKWLSGKDIEFDYNDVIHDGFGYVVISDGTRIDVDYNTYKEERETFNKVQAERLLEHSTNGQEYL